MTKEALSNLRLSIRQNMEDAAMLFMQLPEEEHSSYLENALAAWQLVAATPLTSDLLQEMVVRLFEVDAPLIKSEGASHE